MMYTITRGPSKLVTQRRTGKDRGNHDRGTHVPAPKLVFNRINGKRPPLTIQPMSNTEESYTMAHEENVRFVYEAWQQVEQQLDDSRQGGSGSGPVQYVEKTPSPELKDFVPIDLEDWWAQQFLAKIENGS
ncbi:hypothetical protein JD844_019697 [Phrynosoma platyrhinos]|uniref:MAPK regulated corepressor interacting protein 2 n=1 Tax=Phrynosoma platyrhinos TaxID=52577 RepID=A0ABQ7TPY4_PHRPL|nr:hypothetical protein JD844_019697 [Phrynosoma platyrhinos]